MVQRKIIEYLEGEEFLQDFKNEIIPSVIRLMDKAINEKIDKYRTSLEYELPEEFFHRLRTELDRRFKSRGKKYVYLDEAQITLKISYGILISNQQLKRILQTQDDLVVEKGGAKNKNFVRFATINRGEKKGFDLEPGLDEDPKKDCPF